MKPLEKYSGVEKLASMTSSDTPRHMSLIKWALLSLASATVFMAGCSSIPGFSPKAPVTSEVAMRGFALPAWHKGDYTSGDYDHALSQILGMNANYVSLHATFYQDGVRGTKIFDENRHGGSAPDLDEQLRAIRKAHSDGLKVLLKPHLNLRSGEGWRGDIGKGMTSAEVAAWFESYDAMLVAEATIAETEHVELFAVGTELASMESHADGWRRTIAKVRQVYHGPLVYCANHSDENVITWWDALDFIGVDAYYPLSDRKDPTLAQMKMAWRPFLEANADLAKKFNKRIIYTEVGYMAADGTSIRPYDWSIATNYDGQEQADCFLSLFQEAYRQPWFEGMFIWNWDIFDSSDPRYRMGYSPKGKPAEEIIREWYSGRMK